MTKNDDRPTMASPIHRSAAERVSGPAKQRPIDTLSGATNEPPPATSADPAAPEQRVEPAPEPRPSAGSATPAYQDKRLTFELNELRELERLCRAVRDELGLTQLPFSTFARAYFRILLSRGDAIGRVDRPLDLHIPSTTNPAAMKRFESRLQQYLTAVLRGPRS